MSIHAGQGCHVYVGSEELRYVRSVNMTCPVDGIVTLTIEVIGGFSYSDGVFRLTALPKAPSSADGRSISLTGVPQS